jgi:hypothetical protein
MDKKPNSLHSRTVTSELTETNHYDPSDHGEIVLYQQGSSLEVKVLLKDETVWLSQAQMAELFQTSIPNINIHIRNVFNEGELEQISTVKDFLIVRNEGGRTVERKVAVYCLDVIISVGYRVKSKRGTQFRQWANGVLKEYMLRGHAISQRIERVEHRMTDAEKKIDFFVRTSMPPAQGVFSEGKIFDAHTFVSDLIRSAKRSIILIDNYVDDSVLLLLSKRASGVFADIHTREISPQLEIDLKRHNAQYEPLNIHETKKFHDRFLIVDYTVYHIGASFKDLGKKLFAFSKIEKDADKVFDDIRPA